MYFVQQWYRLADEALEDALYDSAALRDFVGIDLSRQSVPDATTLLHFRHRLEREALTKILFAEINAHLEHLGLLLRRGTLEDATLIAAPPSTKNRDKKRDPDMHQSKKGNQWYLGMKAHIGADAEFGAVHTLETTSGNESDVSQTPKLLHGQEQAVHLDAGYVGVTKRPEVVDAIAAGTIRADVEWFVAARRSTLDKLPDGAVKDTLRKIERCKAQIRARVEHPFHVIKNLFRHRKLRYRGLAKNTAQLYPLFGLANLVLVKRRLWALTGQLRPEGGNQDANDANECRNRSYIGDHRENRPLKSSFHPLEPSGERGAVEIIRIDERLSKCHTIKPS